MCTCAHAHMCPLVYEDQESSSWDSLGCGKRVGLTTSFHLDLSCCGEMHSACWTATSSVSITFPTHVRTQLDAENGLKNYPRHLGTCLNLTTFQVGGSDHVPSLASSSVRCR